MIDFNLSPGTQGGNSLTDIQLDNPVDILLQSINLLFETTPDELVGNLEYGTRYEYYLYDLKASADAINEQVYKDIYSLGPDILGNFKVKSNTMLLQGTERDICLIEIELYNEDTLEKYNKVYRIE